MRCLVLGYLMASRWEWDQGFFWLLEGCAVSVLLFWQNWGKCTVVSVRVEESRVPGQSDLGMNMKHWEHTAVFLCLFLSSICLQGYIPVLEKPSSPTSCDP